MKDTPLCLHLVDLLRKLNDLNLALIDCSTSALHSD